MEIEILYRLLNHLRSLAESLAGREDAYGKSYLDALTYTIGYIEDALYESGVDIEEGGE